MNKLATLIANGDITVEELASAKELIERAELVTKLLRSHLELAVSIATHIWIALVSTKLGETAPPMVRLPVPATGVEIMWLADAIWRTLLKSLWLSKMKSSHMICVGFCVSRLRKQTEFKKRKKYFLFLERGFFFCLFTHFIILPNIWIKLFLLFRFFIFN